MERPDQGLRVPPQHVISPRVAHALCEPRSGETQFSTQTSQSPSSAVAFALHNRLPPQVHGRATRQSHLIVHLAARVSLMYLRASKSGYRQLGVSGRRSTAEVADKPDFVGTTRLLPVCRGSRSNSRSEPPDSVPVPLVNCRTYCCGRHTMEEVVGSIPTRSTNCILSAAPGWYSLLVALRIVPFE
jgi:hypothetical protein